MRRALSRAGGCWARRGRRTHEDRGPRPGEPGESGCGRPRHRLRGDRLSRGGAACSTRNAIETDGHFAGSDFRRADGVPAIRQRSGVRRDLVPARRLWLEPHPRDGDARARAGRRGQDLSRLFGHGLPARRALRPADRATRCTGRWRATSAGTNGEETVARSLGWMARRDRRGLEPGLGGRPAAAFNLVDPRQPDRHALAARPDRSRADRSRRCRRRCTRSTGCCSRWPTRRS